MADIGCCSDITYIHKHPQITEQMILQDVTRLFDESNTEPVSLESIFSSAGLKALEQIDNNTDINDILKEYFNTLQDAMRFINTAGSIKGNIRFGINKYPIAIILIDGEQMILKQFDGKMDIKLSLKVNF